jgi:transcriptional regulator with XRE-family HTH domain
MDVKKEREKRGMTQAQLAEITGIAPAVLSRVENFEVQPQAKTMFKIKQAFGEPTNKQAPHCQVEDLETGEIYQYDRGFMMGWSNLARINCLSRRNEPFAQKGDSLFFDKNQTDPRIEGYFLFRFEKDWAMFYSNSDIRGGDRVFLSCTNPVIDNLGYFEADDLEVVGALVHIGRNVQQKQNTF